MPSLVPRLFIRHLRNEKGIGAEMCPAIVCGIVAGWGRGAAPRRSAIRDFKIWDATTSRTRWLIKDWN